MEEKEWYEDDRPKPIPEEILKMTPEERRMEINRLENELRNKVQAKTRHNKYV